MSNDSIQLLCSEVVYEKVELFHGRKKINIEISTKNLLDFKKIVDDADIKFGIIFGTLLGAVREKNFIEHDEDIDIYVLDEDRQYFLEKLPKLIDIGFKIARYEQDLLSIIRDDDYIDIYFFNKNNFGGRNCNSMTIKLKYFESFDQVDFLGETFYAPYKHMEFIKEIYGDDWMVPKVGIHACPMSNYTKWIILFKKTIKFILPNLVLDYIKRLQKKSRYN